MHMTEGFAKSREDAAMVRIAARDMQIAESAKFQKFYLQIIALAPFAYHISKTLFFGGADFGLAAIASLFWLVVLNTGSYMYRNNLRKQNKRDGEIIARGAIRWMETRRREV